MRCYRWVRRGSKTPRRTARWTPDRQRRHRHPGAPVTNATTSTAGAGFLRAEDCHLEDLLSILAAGTDPAHYPRAVEAVEGVLLYDADGLRHAMTDDDARRSVHSEI